MPVTPAWWYRSQPTLAAQALAPFGAAYGAVTARRMARARPPTPALPVICVGNFTAGGAGKTPVTIALAHLLDELGYAPGILTRGYGAALHGPLLVSPTNHTARQVGDEALLLAQAAPTVLARDRMGGADKLAAFGCNVAVMDDGLQSRRLAFALSLAVVDGQVGIGNGLCVPAGPLRAPVATQRRFVDGVIMLDSQEGTPRAPGATMDAGLAAKLDAAGADGRALAVFAARMRPDQATARALMGRSVIAYSGIARPEKFFATLSASGAKVVETLRFADHHVFTNRDAQRILASLFRRRSQAGGLGGPDAPVLVTTRKDAVRLGLVDPASGKTPHAVPQDAAGTPLEHLAAETLVVDARCTFSDTDDARLRSVLRSTLGATLGAPASG
ncbi:MAG: tetraacyldisaccharide 4'-kinase [Pseudomonadota bacterium]